MDDGARSRERHREGFIALDRRVPSTLTVMILPVSPTAKLTFPLGGFCGSIMNSLINHLSLDHN